METMLAWLMGFIFMVAPLNQPTYYPEAKETTEERAARYQSIASDLLAVAYDPAEKPLPSRGDQTFARAKTALVLLAIASYESQFRKDVDYNLGPKARGDHGKSWCLMQVQLGAPNHKGKSPTRIVLKDDGGYAWAYDGKTGYGGEDLIRDRQLCFRAALHMARVSFNACRHLPAEERLRVYAAGNCGNDGSKASRIRMGRAQRWMANVEMKPPFSDDDFLSMLDSNEGDEHADMMHELPDGVAYPGTY